MQTGNELMPCQIEAQVLEPTSVTPFCLNSQVIFALIKVGFCLSVIHCNFTVLSLIRFIKNYFLARVYQRRVLKQFNLAINAGILYLI